MSRTTQKRVLHAVLYVALLAIPLVVTIVSYAVNWDS